MGSSENNVQSYESILGVIFNDVESNGMRVIKMGSLPLNPSSIIVHFHVHVHALIRTIAVLHYLWQLLPNDFTKMFQVVCYAFAVII